MKPEIIITKERGQSYSTIDLSKSSYIYQGFVGDITKNIDQRFWVIWANKTVMFVDSAMLDGLINSGVFGSYMDYVTRIER